MFRHYQIVDSSASSIYEFRAIESGQSSSRQSFGVLFQSMLYSAFQGEL